MKTKMQNYIIATSSTCDLPRTWLDEHNVPFIAYSYTNNDQPGTDDCREESRAAIYAGMRNGDILKTSQINEPIYNRFFRELMDSGKNVLFLDMSEKMSVSFENCRAAAEAVKADYPEQTLYVMDTRCISGGLGLLVMHCVQMMEEGKSFEEVIAWGEENRLKIAHRFTVDDLNYLKRGGRVSNASALVGTMLSIKPVLYVPNIGTLDVVKKCEKTFSCPIAYVGVDGMLSKEEIEMTPLKAAAANWIATAQIATLISDNCIFIDTGSTTTDIIPVKDGKECAIGKSDFDRSATGELVYTGTLRTNLASFLDKVELNGKEYRVASELFAQTADVYTVLDLITEDDYICDTFDGEGKSKLDCAKRIARVVCADLEMLSMDDIIEMCEFIHKKQVEQIADGLKQVHETQNLDLIVTTGLGKDILDKKAAELLGLEVKSMGDILTDDECTVAPAVGTAVMMEKYLN